MRCKLGVGSLSFCKTMRLDMLHCHKLTDVAASQAYEAAPALVLWITLNGIVTAVYITSWKPILNRVPLYRTSRMSIYTSIYIHILDNGGPVRLHSRWHSTIRDSCSSHLLSRLSPFLRASSSRVMRLITRDTSNLSDKYCTVKCKRTGYHTSSYTIVLTTYHCYWLLLDFQVPNFQLAIYARITAITGNNKLTNCNKSTRNAPSWIIEREFICLCVDVSIYTFWESILYLQIRWKLQKWANLPGIDQWNNNQYSSKFAYFHNYIFTSFQDTESIPLLAMWKEYNCAMEKKNGKYRKCNYKEHFLFEQ